ncbi:MAG: pyrroline-5-carboxylate reductase [Planctomycetia bacterium]|nr:pyrroline-5-carboxylate reductase [Planctomycetia bacterium]
MTQQDHYRMSMEERSFPKIGFIGAGQMATALARGFLQKTGISAERMRASDAYEESRKRFHALTEIKTVQDNRSVAEECDIIILAVKPQVLQDVLQELATVIKPTHCVISIVAGARLQILEKALPNTRRFFRVMPNTPCLVGQGALAFCLSDAVTETDLELVTKLLKSVGRCFLVNEGLMDAVTGLSGSGPAYAFLMIEALADAGVREGIPREIALKLAAETLRGAAEMVLNTGEHPAVLKDRVTSPAGTTIAGLQQLESHGVRAAMYAAVHAATERSRDLGK